MFYFNISIKCAHTNDNPWARSTASKYCLYRSPHYYLTKWKSAQRRKHCALVVVMRAKNFRPAAYPLPRAQDVHLCLLCMESNWYCLAYRIYKTGTIFENRFWVLIKFYKKLNQIRSTLTIILQPRRPPGANPQRFYFGNLQASRTNLQWCPEKMAGFTKTKLE